MVPRARGLGGGGARLLGPVGPGSGPGPCGEEGPGRSVWTGVPSTSHCPLCLGHCPSHSEVWGCTGQSWARGGGSLGAFLCLGDAQRPDSVCSPQGEDGPPGNGTEGFPGFPVSAPDPLLTPPLGQPGGTQDHGLGQDVMEGIIHWSPSPPPRPNQSLA